MATINPKAVTPSQRAELLQDGVTSLITGQNFEERYFDRLDTIWGRGNEAFVLVTGGIKAVITRDSIRFNVGQAVGKLSGIFPFADYLDSESGQIESTELKVDDKGVPNFSFLPPTGSPALQSSDQML